MNKNDQLNAAADWQLIVMHNNAVSISIADRNHKCPSMLEHLTATHETFGISTCIHTNVTSMSFAHIHTYESRYNLSQNNKKYENRIEPTRLLGSVCKFDKTNSLHELHVKQLTQAHDDIRKKTEQIGRISVNNEQESGIAHVHVRKAP